jgi:hypothetical protein
MSEIELKKKGKNKDLLLEAFDTLFNQRDYILAIPITSAQTSLLRRSRICIE